MDRIDLKTKTAAMKALKAGQPINITSGVIALVLVDINADIWISGSANVSIEAWETSTVRNVAWETSTVSNEAWGYSHIFSNGAQCTGTAGANVFITLQNGASCDGGNQRQIQLSTNLDWVEYYGASIQSGQVFLYKGVDENFRSGLGGIYTPGSMPKADKWDGGKVECSHGLHWSPCPSATKEFAAAAAKWVGAWHNIENIVVHWNGVYPQKCMTESTDSPVVEVDYFTGEPVQ